MLLRSLRFSASLTAVLGLGFAAIGVVAACATDTKDSDATQDPDAALPTGKRDGAVDTETDAATSSDSGSSGSLASQTEKEPNDGTTTTETNKMTLPGEMKGAIDPANDKDIFSVDVSPAEWWQWTLTPSVAMAPHVTVFDINADNMNPVRVAFADTGAPAVLDHFVLNAGSFVAAVRDARNVPTPTGKGGPSFTYALTAVKKTLAPTAVTFPSTKSGKLAGVGALDFYSFTATKGTTFGIVIKAARKAQPSTLDSRLSLYNLTTKTHVITNDNAGTSTDSQIGGQIPDSGDYLAIVENEGTNPADLSYDVVFQTTAP